MLKDNLQRRMVEKDNHGSRGLEGPVSGVAPKSHLAVSLAPTWRHRTGTGVRSSEPLCRNPRIGQSGKFLVIAVYSRHHISLFISAVLLRPGTLVRLPLPRQKLRCTYLHAVRLPRREWKRKHQRLLCVFFWRSRGGPTPVSSSLKVHLAGLS